MSLCFLMGCRSDGSFQEKLEVVRVVEYIERVDNGRSAIVSADFYIRTPAVETTLMLLHRGNIPLEIRPGTFDYHSQRFFQLWKERFAPLSGSNNDMAVRVEAREVKLQRFFGETVEEEEYEIVGGNGIGIRPVELTTNTSDRPKLAIDNEQETRAHLPFVLYETDKLPIDKNLIISVQGKLCSESCRRLAGSGGSSFSVYGGDVLIGRLKDEEFEPLIPIEGLDPKSIGHFSDELDFFTNHCRVRPSEYHIVVYTRSGSDHLVVQRLTTDLQFGCKDKEVCAENVTWLWSDEERFVAGIQSSSSSPDLIQGLCMEVYIESD